MQKQTTNRINGSNIENEMKRKTLLSSSKYVNWYPIPSHIIRVCKALQKFI